MNKNIEEKISKLEHLSIAEFRNLFLRNRLKVYIFVLFAIAIHLLSELPYLNIFLSPLFVFLVLSILLIFMLKIPGKIFMVFGLVFIIRGLYYSLLRNDLVAEESGNLAFFSILIAIALLIKDLIKNDN